jgi:hypothetical protein
MKFRKKPIVIEATQWWTDGDHPAVLPVYTYGPNDEHWSPSVPTEQGWIRTLEGEMRVNPGDWIITGVKGEHYACKPDIFEATYEAVEE